jgi:arylsulfatase A-like enzyme
MSAEKICLERPALSKLQVHMRFNRFLILLTALTSLSAVAQTNWPALFSNVQNRAGGIPRRPSIIVIQCRDLAYGDLSCNGQTNFQTPNLDRLAAEGVRFTNYTGGADSAATTAMLLAGQPGATEPGVMNLAKILQQHGYRTGFIGEWTYGREPWRHGFEQFAGFFSDDEARNYYAPEIWRYPRPTLDESNRVTSVSLFHEMLYHNTGGKKGQYIPDVLVTAMNNYVRMSAPDAANRWRPFFLVVNLPAPRSAAADREVFPVPSDAPFTGEAWPQAAKDRAALLTRLDGGIGRLFEQLEKSQLTNNVAVFFASSAAPEKFANTNLNFLLPRDNFRGTNNPAPRLPLLVRFPAKLSAGQVSGLKLAPADFAPTALEIGHAKPMTNFTGKSFLPRSQDARKPR